MGELEVAGSVLETLLSEEDGVAVVKLVGELDLATADESRRAMQPLFDGNTDRVVLDMAELTFMDSTGIALVLSVANRVPHVELRRPSQIIQRVLQVTGLTGILHIVDD